LHHHRCYLKWHQTFQISQLNNEVRDEVQDMYSYQQERLAKEEEKRDKELEKRINILVLGIGIPSLIFTLLDINIIGLTSNGISFWKVLLIGLLGSAVLAALVSKFILKK
ncbi:MAG: hypothetical protein N3B16_00490, partial [Candidatus Aminicenantes bacterium]|nr:hypothetical protein [Candidatus Aminicenantes bacterium]